MEHGLQQRGRQHQRWQQHPVISIEATRIKPAQAMRNFMAITPSRGLGTPLRPRPSLGLGSDSFARVRMGVGPEQPIEDRVSYVLSPFRKRDDETVEEMIERAAEAVRVILAEGIQKAMNRFNRRVRPPET